MTVACYGEAVAIDVAAADWVACHARGLAPDEVEAFEHWCDTDRRHRGSFLRASALRALAEGCVAASPVLPASQAEPPPRFTRRTALLGGGALAACVAGLLALRGGERLSSGLGETRSLPLSDGSVALLNTASTVQVDLGRRMRRIELVKGEAWFDVAHDPGRPFVVRSGALNVRAVGTAFAVRQLPHGGEEVTVTEGIVSVWLDGAEDHAVSIAAGGRGVAMAGVLTRQRLAAGEEDKRLAWRTGMIVLDGQTLGEAAEDFNRYNATKLEIADPALAREPIYGTFRARDPQALARAVAISLDAEVTAGPESLRLGR